MEGRVEIFSSRGVMGYSNDLEKVSLMVVLEEI
jgi:hypothetical protein